MSIPHSITQPANSTHPPPIHQTLTNGVTSLTNRVQLPPTTITTTHSHLPSLGTASLQPQTSAPLTRPSGFTSTTTGQQHPQPRALAGTPTAASFARRISEMDDPMAVYMRELIESVEAARI